jgi:hypothetical protein
MSSSPLLAQGYRTEYPDAGKTRGVSNSKGGAMSRRFLIDAIGWGFVLWLIGYVLGILFFAIVPVNLIGWAIMPIGILIAVWILLTRVRGETLGYYVLVAVVWTVIAVVCDYFLLVLLFKPVDGYYKLDVYLYYVITFVLPIIVGWRKLAAPKPA